MQSKMFPTPHSHYPKVITITHSSFFCVYVYPLWNFYEYTGIRAHIHTYTTYVNEDIENIYMPNVVMKYALKGFYCEI